MELTEWQDRYVKRINDETDNKTEPEKLDLEEDIYCVTFLHFIKQDNPRFHRELMQKSILTFTLQMGLCFWVLGETIGTFEIFSTRNFTKDLFQQVFTGSTQLNGCRYICSYLLHMSIMPEIQTSLQCLRYCINHSYNFNGPHGYLYASSIMWMKLTASILTEVINMVKMGQATMIEDVVKDFIAFEIICQIDNVVGTTVFQIGDLKAELDDNKININNTDTLNKTLEKLWNYDDKKRQGMKKCKNCCMRFERIAHILVFCVMDYFYKIVYYYFFPFLISVVVWTNGDQQLVAPEGGD